jgi:hypothetical protein
MLQLPREVVDDLQLQLNKVPMTAYPLMQHHTHFYYAIFSLNPPLLFVFLNQNRHTALTYITTKWPKHNFNLSLVQNLLMSESNHSSNSQYSSSQAIEQSKFHTTESASVVNTSMKEYKIAYSGRMLGDFINTTLSTRAPTTKKRVGGEEEEGEETVTRMLEKTLKGGWEEKQTKFLNEPIKPLNVGGVDYPTMTAIPPPVRSRSMRAPPTVGKRTPLRLPFGTPATPATPATPTTPHTPYIQQPHFASAVSTPMQEDDWSQNSQGSQDAPLSQQSQPSQSQSSQPRTYSQRSQSQSQSQQSQSSQKRKRSMGF